MKFRAGGRLFDPNVLRAILVVLGIACAPQMGLAQAQFVPLLATGPASNRVDIAFLAEGYTTNQTTKFLADCTNSLNALLHQTPFLEYRGYFNAGAIFVPSRQDGSDHPAYSRSRDTYFNSAYDTQSDYLINIPSGTNGQGKIDALTRLYMPSNELSVLLVNDPVYGGSDGDGKVAIASVGAASGTIVIHEAGHVLANLGDEYDAAFPGFPDIEEPNTTRETRRELLKWQAWVAPETPLPTPESAEYAFTVGAFEGAHYHKTGWFRPKLDCMMNSMQTPFCEVCREALVLSFYKYCSPIDEFAPAPIEENSGDGISLRFSLHALQPVSHAMQVTWILNGGTVASGTNEQFIVSKAALPAGTNIIAAVARDNTEFVRNDPQGLATRSISWTVNIAPAAGAVTLSNAHLVGGVFVFQLKAPAAVQVRVQTSPDLAIWSDAGQGTASPAGLWMTNAIPPNSRQLFYRAKRADP